MERIEVRELRRHVSRYLDRVKSGETVGVTERGQLVALLVWLHCSCHRAQNAARATAWLPTAV